jgi:hypothetical protein
MAANLSKSGRELFQTKSVTIEALVFDGSAILQGGSRPRYTM